MRVVEMLIEKLMLELDREQARTAFLNEIISRAKNNSADAKKILSQGLLKEDQILDKMRIKVSLAEYALECENEIKELKNQLEEKEKDYKNVSKERDILVLEKCQYCDSLGYYYDNEGTSYSCSHSGILEECYFGKAILKRLEKAEGKLKNG